MADILQNSHKREFLIQVDFQWLSRFSLVHFQKVLLVFPSWSFVCLAVRRFLKNIALREFWIRIQLPTKPNPEAISWGGREQTMILTWSIVSVSFILVPKVKNMFFKKCFTILPFFPRLVLVIISTEWLFSQ